MPARLCSITDVVDLESNFLQKPFTLTQLASKVRCGPGYLGRHCSGLTELRLSVPAPINRHLISLSPPDPPDGQLGLVLLGQYRQL